MRLTRLITSVALVALTASGCTDPDGGALDPAAVDDVRGEVQATVAQLNDFWIDGGDLLGFDYAPISMSRIADATRGVMCDGAPVGRDDDLVDNGYVDALCSEGLLLAYDPEPLVGRPLEVLGLLSHEWGHVVQAQHPDIDAFETMRPIDGELQADCFAGAFVADTQTDEIAAALEASVHASGDLPGDDPEGADAHGTGDQRVAAYRLGLRGGPAACLGALR